MSDLSGDEVLTVLELFLSREADSHVVIGKLSGGPDEGKYLATAGWRVEGDIVGSKSLAKETVNEAIVSLMERIDYPEHQRRF